MPRKSSKAISNGGTPEARMQVARVPQVFISYAREDEDRVTRICQRLFDLGVKPWMDKFDLLPGEKWKPSVTKAIERSDFVLVCLSQVNA